MNLSVSRMVCVALMSSDNLEWERTQLWALTFKLIRKIIGGVDYKVPACKRTHTCTDESVPQLAQCFPLGVYTLLTTVSKQQYLLHIKKTIVTYQKMTLFMYFLRHFSLFLLGITKYCNVYFLLYGRVLTTDMFPSKVFFSVCFRVFETCQKLYWIKFRLFLPL